MKRYWILSLLVLAACGEPAEKPAAAAPKKPVVTAIAPAFNTELSTKDLMKHVIDPSADIVWAASGYVVDMKGTKDLSPTTPQGWAIVASNAAIVAEMSNALMLPGRSPEEPRWNGYAKRMHETAMATMRAAEAQDRAGLLRTGGEMYDACTACHTHYILGEK